MENKGYEYFSGDLLFKLDNEHSVVSVIKHEREVDYIPNNYNREISHSEFIKLIIDYQQKY